MCRKAPEEDFCGKKVSLYDMRIRARRLQRAASVWGSSGARSALVVIVLFAVASLPAHGDFFGVAHRGGRIQGPEETLEVFQLTIDLGVTQWLETDAWESSDGVLVIHHDLDMCRTTNIGTFPGFDCEVAANNPLGRFPWIRDFTLAELKTLDVGSWFAPEFAGTTMPTLEEALTLVDGTAVDGGEVNRPGIAGGSIS